MVKVNSYICLHASCSGLSPVTINLFLSLIWLNLITASGLLFSSSSSSSIEWKSKSEECEKEMQEWRKKISNATTSISKLTRQLKSKVSLKRWFYCVYRCDIKERSCNQPCLTGSTGDTH